MELDFYTKNNSELSIYVKTWEYYKALFLTIFVLIFRKRIINIFCYIYDFLIFKKLITEMEQKLSDTQIKHLMEIEIKDNEMEQKLYVLNKEKHRIINVNKKFQNKYNKQIKSYNKISGKFPHLSFEQVIKFDEKLRNNGGSLLCHNGNFIDCLFPKDKHFGNNQWSNFYVKCWNCCPIYQDYCCGNGNDRYYTLQKPIKFEKERNWVGKNGTIMDGQSPLPFSFTNHCIKSITKDRLLSYSQDFEDDEITVIYSNFHMNIRGKYTHKSYDEVLTKKGKQLRETGALDYLKCQETMQNPMPDSYCFCGGKEFSIKEFL